MRFLGIFFAAVLAAAGPLRADEVRYALSPVLDGGVLKAVDVEIVLTGESDGETEVELPNAWGGKTDLWRGISDFRVSGSGLKATTDTKPYLKVIRHAPQAKLTIRYRVAQAFDGDPAASYSNEYRPVVRPTYFHLIGWTIFARPLWSLATPVAVSFESFPGAFASSLEHPVEGGRTLVDLLESITVGGDFRVLKAGALRVAIRGGWGFSDHDFIKHLDPIFASHHKFWGGAAPPFLVTVLPLTSPVGHMSVGGTALSGSFAFMATSNVEDSQLTRILSHEHLHGWIPRQIGTMPQESDSREYWLSEGFTDFYTYRLLVRDALLPLDDAVGAINEIFWNYAFSPARNATNAKAAEGFWSDRDLGEIPYQRGFVFAALVDDRVRRATKGARDLDDVVLAMKAKAVVPHGELAPAIRENFVAAVKAFGVDISRDIDRYIEKGETLLLAADAWGACGSLDAGEVAAFDRGFDGKRTITNGNVVAGVDPSGPAYAAGLRDGMRLQRLDLAQGGDSREKLTYKVLADGTVREISYFPAGKKRVRLQEVKLPAGEGARKACAARIGGTG